MSIHIRPATDDDAETCGAICYSAFRAIASAHNFPPDFPSPDVADGLHQMAIDHPEIYGVVAEVDGEVVGSNFLWEQSDIAGVGPITVDPVEQNRQVRPPADGRSVATRQAKPSEGRAALPGRIPWSLAQPLHQARLRHARAALEHAGRGVDKSIPGRSVRKATADDAAACNALCTRVHGHDRRGEVRDAIAQEWATVVESGGKITGYATLVGFFGHAVAETNDDMKALIAAAPEFSGPGFLLPTRNSDLMRWCLAKACVSCSR